MKSYLLVMAAFIPGSLQGTLRVDLQKQYRTELNLQLRYEETGNLLIEEDNYVQLRQQQTAEIHQAIASKQTNPPKQQQTILAQIASTL